MTAPAAVAITDLDKRYGEARALRGVSLHVTPGEIFGLIGPDGAGKTTLMRIACGLLLPDHGATTVMGFDSAREAQSVREQIGYMPQRFSLYPDLTISENLRFYADLHHVSARDRVVREAKLMEFSRLAPFKQRRAGNLSGGMKQKLALCCTLIHSPNVLILDEPTTGVDPVSRREFWDILKTTAAEGRAILVSTPYMDEAALCHRIALIHRGALLGAGVPADITGLFKRQLLEIRGEQLEQARHRVAEIAHGRIMVNRFGDRLHLIFDQADDETLIRGALRDIRVDVAQIEPTIEDTFVSLMEQTVE